MPCYLILRQTSFVVASMSIPLSIATISLSICLFVSLQTIAAIALQPFFVYSSFVTKSIEIYRYSLSASCRGLRRLLYLSLCTLALQQVQQLHKNCPSSLYIFGQQYNFLRQNSVLARPRCPVSIVLQVAQITSILIEFSTYSLLSIYSALSQTIV